MTECITDIDISCLPFNTLDKRRRRAISSQTQSRSGHKPNKMAKSRNRTCQLALVQEWTPLLSFAWCCVRVKSGGVSKMVFEILTKIVQCPCLPCLTRCGVSCVWCLARVSLLPLYGGDMPVSSLLAPATLCHN